MEYQFVCFEQMMSSLRFGATSGRVRTEVAAVSLATPGVGVTSRLGGRAVAPQPGSAVTTGPSRRFGAKI
jgi:hypothetical protein